MSHRKLSRNVNNWAPTVYLAQVYSLTELVLMDDRGTQPPGISVDLVVSLVDRDLSYYRDSSGLIVLWSSDFKCARDSGKKDPGCLPLRTLPSEY